MNCKQIQELLPLYAGRDLEVKRERLVAAHVEACAACAAEANEYREGRQWLQEFAPPAFSEAVYADMRRNVLRDIESAGPTFAELMANLFRPRLAWAMATVVLIAIALFGLYFMTGRQSAPNPMAGKPAPAGQTTSYEWAGIKNTASPSGSDQQAGNQPRPGRTYRKVITGRSGSVAVNAVKQSPLDRNVLPTVQHSNDPNVFSAGDEVKIMRVEMQTKDPNIRIIWFSQQNSKTISNSKGS